LASGGHDGEIKVWNAKEQSCIRSFDPCRGHIHSLFFAGGADSTCVALTCAVSVIRLWRAEGSSDFASETIGEADLGGSSLHDSVFSPSGSFVATSSGSITGNESTLALHEIETMTKTQSVVMLRFIAACVAVSLDSKQSVSGGDNGGIQLFQTNDFSIQRNLDATAEAKAVCVAFDPTCRVLAFGCNCGRLELQSLQMSTERSAICLELSASHTDF
jgi:WD40 repeat protein